VEIGDLHYFAAPPRAFHALSPQRRHMAKVLIAAGAAVMWLALLLASFATVDWTKRPGGVGQHPVNRHALRRTP
jgi:hypothetical protein